MTLTRLNTHTKTRLVEILKRISGDAPIIVVVFWGLLVAFPWLVTPLDPLRLDVGSAVLPPSADHWFGTDQYGRDVFSRCIYGLRTSLGAALFVAVLATSFGIFVGGVAGLGVRWLDSLLMRTTDIFLAFPYLILAIALSAAIGPGIWTAILVLSLLWWPSYARMVRGQVLSLRESSFVLGATAVMTPWWKILFRHLVPHMLPQLSARFSLEVGGIVIALTSLGFLGLGAQPPGPELGVIIAEGREYILTAWWISTLPGLFIIAIVVTSLFASDWIERRLS
ncbi:peptide/nickel transport system permease protein [Rhodoglobus vestalii]|uniref:Peptide/nickel transport system permease protein n=1 Tax=Rhodoglobus vestalii TaxID=193384 RepID=A0A8H2K8V9_9MICO|nr:peptide/nickel transport system permease protein [Rhodoglobus vestalii]